MGIRGGLAIFLRLADEPHAQKSSGAPSLRWAFFGKKRKEAPPGRAWREQSDWLDLFIPFPQKTTRPQNFEALDFGILMLIYNV